VRTFTGVLKTRSPTASLSYPQLSFACWGDSYFNLDAYLVSYFDKNLNFKWHSSIVRHCARDVSIHAGTRNPGTTFYDYLLGFANHVFDIIEHFTSYSQMRNNQFLACFIDYLEDDILRFIDIVNLQGASRYLRWAFTRSVWNCALSDLVAFGLHFDFTKYVIMHLPYDCNYVNWTHQLPIRAL